MVYQMQEQIALRVQSLATESVFADDMLLKINSLKALPLVNRCFWSSGQE